MDMENDMMVERGAPVQENVYASIISGCHSIISEMNNRLRPVLSSQEEDGLREERTKSPEAQSILERELCGLRERLDDLNRNIKM